MMSTKVEQASRVEDGIQTAITSTSSAASTSSPKFSKFAAKSGFVIPKNKLSGSLVPIFRGSKKAGGSGPISEESSKETQRKTKWGTDMTQDAAVKKGKSAAYQTRVDQITKLLNSGIVDIEDDPSPAPRISGHKSSSHPLQNEKSELLELERREAIGEILKLNPSYKVPSDYKPLLREARVPIPIKEYPGLNFISLVYGPGGDTQKRLEKETGAKVCVFGIKPETEKKEVTADDNQNLYEELYVHVCADTYEKVDAAVALIELLVKPVSANPTANATSSPAVSSDNINVVHASQGTHSPYIIRPPPVNQGLFQPVTGPGQVQPLGQFQPYPGAWFSTNSQQTFSAPILSNPVQVSSAPLNSSNMPSYFGPRPAGFGSFQSPSFVPSRPQPLLQQPFMPQATSLGYNSQPRNPHVPSLQPTPGQSSMSVPPPFSANQPTALGPPQVMGPMVPQSGVPATFTAQSFNPSGSSSTWSQAPTGPSNTGQMTLPVVPPQRPLPVASQPNVLSGGSPFGVTSGSMVSPITTPFQPSPSQPSGPAFTPVLQPNMGFPPASSSLHPTPGPSAVPAMTRAMLPGMPSNTSMPAPLVSLSTPSTLTLPPHPQSGVQISSSATSPATTPKPPHPHSNNFTFQPHRPQNPAPQMIPGQNIQPAPQGMPPRNLNVHPPQAHQISSFRPLVQNTAPPLGMQGFSRPQVSHNMNQPRPQMSLPSAGNLNSPHGLPRHPAFPIAGLVSPGPPAPQMGMRNFGPGPQVINTTGAFPFRPGNTMQPQQNYPSMATRPQGGFSPNQQFMGNLPFPSSKPAPSPFGGQQNYDPFSPSSVPLRPQPSSNPPQPRKQESDPEYEDLMASVGVK